MEKKSHLVLVTDDEYVRVERQLQSDDSIMNRSIDAVLEWYKYQAHLPQLQPPPRTCIKSLLAISGMSIEKVKAKIDAKCTLRTLMPELFRYSDLFCGTELADLTEKVYWVPLPNLNSDLSRVTVFKINPNVDHIDFMKHFKRSFMVGDYRLHHEWCMADRFIIDLEHLKMSHVTSFNPVSVRKSEYSSSKAYGLKLAGIHVLNAPPIADQVLSIFRRILKPKLAARIIVHPNMEHLHNYIDKRILPKEYAGDIKSLKSLNDEWLNEITAEKWKKTFIEEEQLKSDESKRTVPHDVDEALGLQGSFRKLDVD